MAHLQPPHIIQQSLDPNVLLCD
eukprot:COSAG02_NODE_48834_length_331_cov_0.668103_1_plen_22_part_01